MGIYINNDAINFAQEFKTLCDKYVENASLVKMYFDDGSTIGMKTLLQIGLGVKTVEECII